MLRRCWARFARRSRCSPCLVLSLSLLTCIMVYNIMREASIYVPVNSFVLGLVPSNGRMCEVHIARKSLSMKLEHWVSDKGVKFSNFSHSPLVDVYRQRLDHVESTCSGREENYKGQYDEAAFNDHIYVNPKYGVLYCGVEKVGLTFWRRVFRVLNQTSVKSPFDIHPFLAYQGESFAHVMTFADLTANQRAHAHSNFTKFMFVRDPYERLFSAYIDKLYFPNGNYWSSLGAYIVKSYRTPPNVSGEDVCGHDVTFKELVQFVIDNQKTLYYRDNHFIPVYEHCRPCQMKYDFIGKFQTFSSDIAHVLQEIGAINLAYVLQMSSTDVLRDLFIQDVYFLFWFKEEVSRCLNFYESLKRLWEVMKIRELIDAAEELPFRGDNSGKITQKELLSALTKASKGNNREKALRNRRNAMVKAYRHIDKRMLFELRNIFQPDCDIFEYNCEPDDIFSSNVLESGKI